MVSWLLEWPTLPDLLEVWPDAAGFDLGHMMSYASRMGVPDKTECVQRAAKQSGTDAFIAFFYCRLRA